eukprot:8904055-Karenia_brevis.AAC.1
MVSEPSTTCAGPACSSSYGQTSGCIHYRLLCANGTQPVQNSCGTTRTARSTSLSKGMAESRVMRSCPPCFAWR